MYRAGHVGSMSDREQICPVGEQAPHDRGGGFLADKPDADIRELRQDEIDKYERCLACAG